MERILRRIGSPSRSHVSFQDVYESQKLGGKKRADTEIKDSAETRARYIDD